MIIANDWKNITYAPWDFASDIINATTWQTDYTLVVLDSKVAKDQLKFGIVITCI